MIPSSAIFDQSVMQQLLDFDPVVQDYRALAVLSIDSKHPNENGQALT